MLAATAVLAAGPGLPSAHAAPPVADSAALAAAADIPTLRRALEAAWARQPEARALGARRDAADARRRTADAWTPEPPAVEAGLRTDRLHRNEGQREWEVGVSVPLWLRGERDGRRALGSAEAAVVDAQADAARWRLAGTVREAWWTLALARDEATGARQRLDAARTLAADVARRVRAGDLARVDSHQADGEVAAAEAELARREAAERQAILALQAIVGAVAVLPGGAAAPGEAEPVADGPGDDHPELREAAARADVARRSQALAALQRRPHPEVAVGITRERGSPAEPWSGSVSVALRVPLGRADLHRAGVAAAEGDRIEAETALGLARERLQAEARAAQAEAGAARLAAVAAERRATLARETRGFVDRSFRAGESGLPERLRVDREAAEAEREAVRARLEWARAVSRWRQALGQLPD